jgi:hypothetical protein
MTDTLIGAEEALDVGTLRLAAWACLFAAAHHTTIPGMADDLRRAAERLKAELAHRHDEPTASAPLA